MAWIQIDKELEDTAEFMVLRAATGESEADVGWRLKKFWSWVDDHAAVTGRLERVMTPAMLATKFGGGEKFWEAMQAVGWLAEDEKGLIIPEYKKRFGKSAKARKLSSERSRRYREGKAGKKSRSARDASRVTDSDAERDEGVTVTPNHASRRDETDTRQDHTKPEETQAHSSSSSSSRAPDVPPGGVVLGATRGALKYIEEGVGKGLDWEAVREECPRIVADMRGGKCEAVGDRDLVAKVAALMLLGMLSEHEVRDACVAVAKKVEREPATKRYAYLHAVLASKLAERQVTFNAVLAALSVPEEIRQPKLAK